MWASSIFRTVVCTSQVASRPRTRNICSAKIPYSDRPSRTKAGSLGRCWRYELSCTHAMSPTTNVTSTSTSTPTPRPLSPLPTRPLTLSPGAEPIHHRATTTAAAGAGPDRQQRESRAPRCTCRRQVLAPHSLSHPCTADIQSCATTLERNPPSYLRQ